MTDSFIQVRTNEEDKKKASEILGRLGTNLSAVINMLIRQIIETESIPFGLKLSTADRIEKDSEEIRELLAAFSPGDTVKLAMESETPEERRFFELLGDYILQVGQKMAIERNLY